MAKGKSGPKAPAKRASVSSRIERGILAGFGYVPKAKPELRSNYRALGPPQHGNFIEDLECIPGARRRRGNPQTVGVSHDLLLETGSYLLLETGFKIILEP